MELLITKQQLEDVYTGYYATHDKDNCSDCRNNIPCQYTVDQEWHKLGYTTIEPGKTFSVVEPMGEGMLRLIDDQEFTYDVNQEQYNQLFG